MILKVKVHEVPTSFFCSPTSEIKTTLTPPHECIGEIGEQQLNGFQASCLQVLLLTISKFGVYSQHLHFMSETEYIDARSMFRKIIAAVNKQ